MRNSLRRLATATTIGVVVVLGAASAAYASNDPGKTAVDNSSSHANWRTPVVHLSPGSQNKPNGVTPNVTGSGGTIAGYHATTITPPGGSSGTFDQGFTSNYSSGCDFWSCTIDVSSGTSYTHWLGSSPWNADSMSLTNQVWVGGLEVSVSVGSSPSAGFTVTGYTVTMTSSLANTWQLAHSFTNIKFSTNLAMWGPYENSSDSATFSYETFYDYIS